MKLHDQLELVWDERAPAILDAQTLAHLEDRLHFKIFHLERPFEVIVGRRMVFRGEDELSFLRLLRIERTGVLGVQLLASHGAQQRARFASLRLQVKELLAGISDYQEQTTEAGVGYQVGVKDLLAANAHLGQRTQRWNPKMKPYIVAVRGGFHVIDLLATIEYLNEAHAFVNKLLSEHKTILFVGTRAAARDLMGARADDLGMPSVTVKWLGGMLTNWNTTQERLARLRELNDGDINALTSTKKEAVLMARERARLERRFGGLLTLKTLPDAMFVVDPVRERLAVAEAQRLEIPVVALMDTDADPDLVDFKIPANPGSEACVDLVMRVITSGPFELGEDERIYAAT